CPAPPRLPPRARPPSVRSPRAPRVLRSTARPTASRAPR
ncbi:MAG: hypothetical protein AVDCRST_MAG40-1671, partial [uncultured Gemmatimonadaceae bacterium]